MNQDTIQAPDAIKKKKVLIQHGDKRTDPYYWMRDRDNPQIKKYLKAENAYTKAVLDDAEQLQNTIYDEIVSRINPEEESVPYEYNGFIYYSEYDEGNEYPVHLRKRIGEKDKQVILDINKMAEGHDYYHVNSMSISPDNKWLAYGVDTVSRRIYTIHFKNLETGEILEEKIENTTGSCTWAGDNKTVYYSTKDETLRPCKIWTYKRGEPDSKKLIYEEKDATYVATVYKTKSREFIIIGSYATLSQEYRYLHVDDVGGEFKIFQERQPELEHYITHAGADEFYIITNKDAQNFKLMKCSLSASGQENWEEVIPHREDVFLEDIEIFRDYLVLCERKDGLTQARIISRGDSGIDYYFEPDDEIYVLGPAYNREFVSDKLIIAYQSMVSPARFYSVDMKNGKKSMIKKKKIPNYDQSLYDSKREWATADDGTRIPISLVYKKGIELDGKNPLLLYGYGSYGHSIEPGFSSSIMSLLDRGFVYAIAHVRGGSEMGRYWYDEGKLLNKKNTFTDFIACANALIDKNYTHPQILGAMGGSAGGLLMGAVVNMAPELFDAVIAAVPFVDVVTTMLDDSIPLTTGEYDEWGNPNIEKYYDYILSYSPYDNVSAQSYPAMLVTTGLHDSQVQYWEPAKWVAKIRDYNTGTDPVLLYTNMDTGHSGASGRYKRHKEAAMKYAFLVTMLK